MVIFSVRENDIDGHLDDSDFEGNWYFCGNQLCGNQLCGNQLCGNQLRGNQLRGNQLRGDLILKTKVVTAETVEVGTEMAIVDAQVEVKINDELKATTICTMRQGVPRSIWM